jgi:ABC-2 type transport system permease protein
MNEKNLWIHRAKTYWLQASRYIQYMLNSLIYTVIITVVIAAYYYAAWLKTLESTFPYLFVLSIFIASVLTIGKVRTFLREADKVFLLPFEHKLKTYFRFSLIYSTLFHLFYIGLLLLVLYPLYEKYEYATDKMFYISVVVVMLLKVWNLMMSWYISRMNERTFYSADFIVRFTINFLFVYFLYAQAGMLVIALMIIILFSLYMFYNNKFGKRHRIQWEYLIKVEENSVSSFYRLANLFTDVPHLKTKIKPRKLLTQLIKLLVRKENGPFSYLYWRTFIRAGDYFGIYVRLILIGSLLILFIPSEYATIAVYFLFLYLSGFQLLSLWKHFDVKIIINLYPISIEKRKQQFRKVYQLLLILQSILLFIVMLLQTSNYVYEVIAFVISIILIISYSRVVLRKKG